MARLHLRRDASSVPHRIRDPNLQQPDRAERGDILPHNSDSAHDLGVEPRPYLGEAGYALLPPRADHSSHQLVYSGPLRLSDRCGRVRCRCGPAPRDQVHAPLVVREQLGAGGVAAWACRVLGAIGILAEVVEQPPPVYICWRQRRQYVASASSSALNHMYDLCLVVAVAASPTLCPACRCLPRWNQISATTNLHRPPLFSTISTARQLSYQTRLISRRRRPSHKHAMSHPRQDTSDYYRRTKRSKLSPKSEHYSNTKLTHSNKAASAPRAPSRMVRPPDHPAHPRHGDRVRLPREPTEITRDVALCPRPRRRAIVGACRRARR